MLLYISKEEYRLLVEMIQVADYVMHAHDAEPKEATKDYRAFRKKVFSNYKKMGLESLFRYSEEHTDYIETEDSLADSRHTAVLENFVEREFWAQLTQRLSMRDLVNKLGDDEVAEMDPMVFMEKVGEASGVYDEEFEAHGLERLTIEKDD